MSFYLSFVPTQSNSFDALFFASKCLEFQVERGGGVSQLGNIADKGGRGGVQTPINLVDTFVNSLSSVYIS